MNEFFGIVDPQGRPLKSFSSMHDVTGVPQFQFPLGGSSLNNLNYGGIRNPTSGLGSASDKVENTFFVPNQINNAEPLDTIYVQSWTCRKFIDMPIDDMFIRGREYEDKESEDANTLERLDYEYRSTESLRLALKAGRLYGTAMVVIITDEDPSVPFDLEEMKEGSLKSILVFDRYDASILEWYARPDSPKYGQALMYRFSPSRQGTGTERGEQTTNFLSGGFECHESRVLRFEGISPMSSNGWRGYYDRDWGVSEIVSAINDLLQDAIFSQAVAHLAQEASIPVIKSQGLKDAMVGITGPDEASIAQIGASINMSKSIWNTMFIDSEDDFQRVGVSLTGFEGLLSKYSARIAAMAGIPETRFLGRSPAGFNATGESDMANYGLHVQAMQNKLLKRPFAFLDRVLCNHAGIETIPEYKLRPLQEISESEEVSIESGKAGMILQALQAGVIDENEARERLGKLKVFGELKPWSFEQIIGMKLPEVGFGNVMPEPESNAA